MFNRPRLVVIGFPSFDGRNDVLFTHAYAETVRLSCANGTNVAMCCRAYDAALPRARNDVLRDAVKANCDDVVLIDTDIGWLPEWIFKLLSYPVDVVGGTYRKKTDEEEVYEVRCLTMPIPRDPATGLLIVDGLPTGFLRLSRKAIDAVRDVAEDYVDDPGIPNKWVFEAKPIGGYFRTEDYVLSAKLQELGFKLYLDPDMTCAHVGGKIFRGDFAAWLAKRESG